MSYFASQNRLRVKYDMLRSQELNLISFRGFLVIPNLDQRTKKIHVMLKAFI